MYIEVVLNRNSPPCTLLRESFRQDGKVCKRTLANLTKLPQEAIEGLRALLRGGTVVEDFSQSFEVIRSQPYGHVAAVLGTLRQIGLERDLDPKHSIERDLVVAMIVARILEPSSKLATARGLGQDARLSALVQELDLPDVNERDLYAALDWLYERQDAIERRLARRHLQEGSLVLYDVTSTYFEGHSCPLAQLGYSRDGKKGTLQIVFGLLCNHAGCPIAVEVFAGNTADPKTLTPQVEKVRQKFGLKRVIFVGDRGMLTSARLREDFQGAEGLGWISALRTTEIQRLVAGSGFQFSLFDDRDFGEVHSPEFPGERLIACRNPLLQQKRASTREELLQATERELQKIADATQRPKNKLQGKDRIALRVGKRINRSKMEKHFVIEITETSFSFRRDLEKIAAEAALDGLYVIRTNVNAAELSAEDAVRSYKSLSTVERAFRCCKTVDLHVRPIYHQLEKRVKAHVLLCMLAYYVEWHMRQKLAPLLFEDEEPAEGESLRSSIVAPAQRSPSAQKKVQTLQTADGQPAHSFATLLKELATLTRNRVQPKISASAPFDTLARPTPLQQKAFSLLAIAV